MKKKLIFLSIFILIAYLLVFPTQAVHAAATGLILWYERVLPSLLPFAILSNILIYSNAISILMRYLYPVIRPFFPCSPEGGFVLLTGFLFGFPMGSKNCAELLKAGKLEKEEADLLFIITNNISPVFISSYILCQELNTPSLIGISYLILYLPPLILGAFWCRFFSRSGKTAGQEKTPTSGSQMNFKIIDAGIMNGFETLTRLGGYIMLFSIFASILTELPLCLPIKTLLIGITEITNGIHQLPSSGYPGSTCYVLAMAFTAFGGLSGVAQTSSMVKGCALSMKQYLLAKILLAILSGLLAYGVMYCMKPF